MEAIFLFYFVLFVDNFDQSQYPIDRPTWNMPHNQQYIIPTPSVS